MSAADEIEHLRAGDIVQVRRSKACWPGNGTPWWVRLTDGRWRRIYADGALRYINRGDERVIVDETCSERIIELKANMPVGVS